MGFPNKLTTPCGICDWERNFYTSYKIKEKTKKEYAEINVQAKVVF